MPRLITILLLILLFSGCESYQNENLPDYGLEFYHIKDFQRIANTSKIINNSVILSDTVIIHYDDIISYDSNNYTFTVTEKTINYLNDNKYNVYGTPFAVVADNKLIYTGYFWPGFFSAAIDWVVIDPINYSGKNRLTVQLGYPGLFEGDSIPDNRNDKRILDILRRDSKLIKSN
jgi:hypothetical protein